MLGKSRWLLGAAAAAAMCLLILQVLSLRQQEKTQVAIDRLAGVLADSAGARGTPSGPAPTRFVLGQANAVSPDELRAIVREELQALGDRSKAGGGTETKPAATVSPEQTAENAAAFQEAKRVVDEALAAGVWDARRRDAFRTVRGKLTTEQLEAVSRQLFPAINAQRLRVAVDGPFL